MPNLFTQAAPIVGAGVGFALGGAGGAALGAGIGGQVASIGEQQEAQAQQRRAARAQRRIADIQAARQRSEAVREATIARGRVENVSAAAGGTSSRAAGASSSLGSQLGSNLGFSFQTQAISSQASSALQRAADAQTRSSIFSSISNVGMSLYTNAGRTGTPASSQGSPQNVITPNQTAVLDPTYRGYT